MTTWAAFTFFVAYWQWFVVGAIVCVGLGYVAVILKNWRAAAAVAAIVCAFLVVGYVDNMGYNRRVAMEVAERTTILQDRINLLETQQREHNARAEADAAAIAALQEQVAATPRNDKVVLPRDVVDRIRKVR